MPKRKAIERTYNPPESVASRAREMHNAEATRLAEVSRSSIGGFDTGAADVETNAGAFLRRVWRQHNKLDVKAAQLADQPVLSPRGEVLTSMTHSDARRVVRGCEKLKRLALVRG